MTTTSPATRRTRGTPDAEGDLTSAEHDPYWDLADEDLADADVAGLIDDTGVEDSKVEDLDGGDLGRVGTVSLRRVSRRGHPAPLTTNGRLRARALLAHQVAAQALAQRFPHVEPEARSRLRDCATVGPLTPAETVDVAQHAWGAAWQIQRAMADPTRAVQASVNSHAGGSGPGYSYGTTPKGTWLVLHDTHGTRYGLVTWREITSLLRLGSTPELQRSMRWIEQEQHAHSEMQHGRAYLETLNDPDAPRRWCPAAWDAAGRQLHRQSHRAAHLWWDHARTVHAAATGEQLDLFTAG